MKYVLLFGGTLDDERELEQLSAEEFAVRYAVTRGWFAEYADCIHSSHRLQTPEHATTVRLDAGKPVVIDGPYVESNEIIGGFAVVEVADLDEALAMAKRWPASRAVEIRPVVERVVS